MTTSAAAQTITLGGRIYTFTTEDAEVLSTLNVLGSLFNSRGQFFGSVVEANGRRSILSAHRCRWSLAEERAALSALQMAA